ncbi:MAG: AsmA family protein [Syntrophorhabdaceae bacterium PtaU1.Bin034]|nr:MAG: AsmA family protein [Syntrophorhabdaceae bacterium PtaU1.Bin034]
MKRFRKFATVSVLSFAAITLIGFFALSPILKSVLVSKLSQTLDRPVSIGQIRTNPLLLTVKINNFVVKERGSDADFFAFQELFVDLEAVSLLKRAVIAKEIRLSGPYVYVSRNADGNYNFSDVLTKASSGGETQKTTSGTLHFSLGNISIKDGGVDFDDAPKDARHQLREINIGIPFISNIPHYVETFVQPAFSATINGEPYSVNGKVKPFAESRESNVEISVKDVDITRYLPYAPVKMNFKLLSALVDVGATVSFIRSRDKGPSLVVSGNVGVSKLSVDDLAGDQLLRVPSLRVAVNSFEPLSKRLHVENVTIEAPQITVRREKNGSLNLQNLVPLPEEREKIPETQEKAVQAASGSESFKMTVDKVELNAGTLLFHDLTVRRPVNLELNRINVLVAGFSTEKDAKSVIDAGLVYEKKGSITIKGTMGLDPLASDLSVEAKGMAIGTLQPYFTKKVKITVTDGNVSLEGNLKLTSSGSGGPRLLYTGKVFVSRFSSIDRHNGDDFVKCKALSLSAVNIGYNPAVVRIGGISLADFYARLIVNPDGSLNLQNIMAEDPEGQPDKHEAAVQRAGTSSIPAQASGQGQATDPAIEIGTITLQGGTIDFMDRLIKPAYTANLSDMGGRISGLSMKRHARADVEVRGTLDHSVPLEIVGKINPSKEHLFADLVVKFRDLDLSPMTPYSGKYAGYSIQKGKLSIDLKYLIDNRKLDSTNVIFFDQFIFGDKVESPSATKLPVRLAVALLKDRHGQIKLSIPVSGSIDDPEFSVWRIVLQVVVNLIAKAATSPFALLGSLFGGGEELSYVEFEHGSTHINEASMKKIDTLITALYDRPALKLEIEGHVDMEKDKDALKDYFFMRKLKARKLQEMIKKGEAAIPVDEVTIGKQEYEKFLALAYKTEKFDKPKNLIGLTKNLPAAEMEKLMMTHTVVEDQDLRTLANQRATVLKDHMLKSGKVTAERVFVVEPKSLMPERKQNLKDSRADFRLK